jgi:xylulokinase
VTDNIDAEGSLLFDPIKKRWNRNLIDLVDIEPKILPGIVNPLDVIGNVTEEGSLWSGLRKGTPVITGSTDTLCEVFAARSLKPGDCTVKLATYGRVCVITDKPYSGKGLINYSYIIPGLWYPGTGTRSFGSSMRWFRNEFCRDIRNSEDAFSIMDSEAAEIQPTSEGLIFHPYLQGENSPYDDPYLRGDFLGLTLHHTRGHMIRAILEGTAFSILDCVNFIDGKGIKVSEPVKFIGGGIKSKLWSDILADVLGKNAVVPQDTDPSIGVALLAGVGTGIFRSVKEAIKKFNIKREINYDPGRSDKYKKFFNIYKKAKNINSEINYRITGRFS